MGQPGAQPVGRLGPAQVGQRVVVRRVLRGRTGPSGGPAMTDVLGVMESWGDGVTALRREDGSVVTIETADIVAGKPVPPRPSVRMRVPARDIELRSFADDPMVERSPLGDWVVRVSPPMEGRLLKRTNSALAMGDPGLPLAEAGERVVTAYRARDRRPLAQVEQGSDTEAALRELGWEPLGVGDSLTLLTSVAQLARLLPGLRDDAEVEEGPARVTVSLEGGAARGTATISDEWLCLLGLHVAEEHRRRGLGRAVLAELVDWGASRGATTAWLHVESDNEPALALWEGLGFRTHHANRYLTRD